MKILVAIPVYSGLLPIESVRCLLNEQVVACANGDELQVVFQPNCSVPAMGRNQLVDIFLKSESDKLFFLDSDITFEPGAILGLCHKPVDIVGGAYRYKLDQESYPVGLLTENKYLQWDENKLIEISSLPAGFMSISRNAFETLRSAYPDKTFEHMGMKLHCFFETPFVNGSMWSEESHFFKEWREIGGKVYLDPEISLTHWDFKPVPYPGHIGNWFKSRNGISQT